MSQGSGESAEQGIQEQQGTSQENSVFNFRDEWLALNSELDNVKQIQDDQQSDKIKEINIKMYSAIERKARSIGINDMSVLFTNQAEFDKLANALAGDNVSIVQDNGKISMAIGSDNESSFIIKNNNGEITHSINYHNSQQQGTDEEQQQPQGKKKNLLPIVLIIFAILLLALLAVLLILNHNKKEEQEKGAKQELHDGVTTNNSDTAPNGTYEIDQKETFKDADGKTIKLSEDIVFKDGALSSEADRATYIENHPNANYTINGTKVLNPQAGYDSNGNKIISFYSTASKETISMDASKIKSFTCNGTNVDNKTVDLMCSYDKHPDGTISFSHTTSDVKIDKNSGALSVSIYTDGGNLVSNYSKDNIVKNGNDYGFNTTTNGAETFNKFPDTIQTAISNALDTISTKYPDYDLSQSVKGYDIKK